MQTGRVHILMGGIYESDNIPTERDISASIQMFGEGEDVDTDKLAHEVARQKRVTQRQGSELGEILTCLNGDAMGRDIGMIQEQRDQGKLLTEIHTLVTQTATTAIIKRNHSKSDGVDEVTKERVTMIWGVLLFGAFIANALISWFS